MSRARTLADFISTGAGTGILADGAIDTTEITGVTVSSTEINRLAGVGADVQTQINAKAATSSLAAVATSGAASDVSGLGTAATLNVGTAATNIPQLDGTGKLPAIDGSQLTGLGVTQGTLTKTFTQNETAEISLGQAVTPTPVVSATKEVPQTGITSKGSWDVNATGSNYDLHNTAANVTLTPSTVGYNLSALSYEKLFYTNRAINDIAISSDGTRIYYISNNEFINQRTLSTAFDISTAGSETYYDQSSQDNDPRDMTFKPDGTKMYLTGDNTDRIYQYSLSTAWDITTASYDSKSFDASSQTSAPKSTQFKSDGTKMYVCTNGTIYQYSLSTAWDLSTVSYTSTSFTISNEDGSNKGIFLKTDGTKMYTVGSDNDKVYQYNFGTAWDLSTLSYNSSTVALTSTSSNAVGITFSSDGTKLYVGDYTSKNISQYIISTSGLTLGSGSFSATDVGRRIVGNGGDVLLSSTSGTFDTTGGSAFTDNSTIAAGSWQMFGMKPTASGLSLAPKQSGAYDISSNTIGRTKVTSTIGGKFTATVPYGGAFVSPDGTMLFVNEEQNVRRYDMSTPHDLTTLSTAQNTMALNSTYNKGLTFRPDGLRMYTCGESANTIKQYVLATAWQPSSTSNSQTTLISERGTDQYMQQIRFNADGTRVFILWYQGQYQLQSFDLATAYDVTSTKSNEQLNPSGTSFAIYSNLRDFTFVDNGNKILVTRDGNDLVFVGTLSTAYDISTISHVNANNFEASGTQSPRNIAALHEQGGFLYTVNNTNSEYVWQFTVQSALAFPDDYFPAITNSTGQIDTQSWLDINSMTADETVGGGQALYAVSTDNKTTWSVNKGTGGVRPIVRNNSGTWQYNTAESLWGISSASYTNTSFSVNSQESNPTGIVFKPDGTKMYITGYSGDDVNEYNLSPAFDITSATYSQNFSVQSQDSVPNNIFFKPDGTKMYMVGSSSDNINEYSLSTAWNVSTLSYVRYLGMPSGLQNPTGIFFKSDGTRMYIVADPNKAVMYSLSTAWDISTASVSHTHTVAENTLPQDLFFKDDGTKVYILGEGGGNQKVYEYNLSTAWDLSTISYSSYSFDVSPQSPGCKAMTFKPDGSKMYILGTDNDIIYEYNTLSYGTSATWSNGTVNNELYTLQQALSLESNRMNKAQLDAIPDANHFTLGNTLDLMIALQLTADGGVRPTSDGVTINYNANALNEGAVLGTDYDYFFPSSTKVQIKSLAAQNLKVRVV